MQKKNSIVAFGIATILCIQLFVGIPILASVIPVSNPMEDALDVVANANGESNVAVDLVKNILAAEEESGLDALINGLSGLDDNEAIGQAIDWENDLLGLGLSGDEEEEAEDFGQKFLRILQGQMTSDELVGYVVVMVIIVAGLMGAAQALFPEFQDGEWPNQGTYKYSQLYNTMSSLGNRERSSAWGLFTAAMIVQALLYVPLIFNLWDKLAVIDETWASVVGISFLIGCVGMILLGLMDESMGTPHDISAIVCFGGFIMGIAVAGVMFLTDGEKLPIVGSDGKVGQGIYDEVRPTLNVLYGICIFTIVGLGISQLIRVVLDLDRDNKELPAALVNWPLWEWICWYTLQIAIPWMVLTLNQVDTSAYE